MNAPTSRQRRRGWRLSFPALVAVITAVGCLVPIGQWGVAIAGQPTTPPPDSTTPSTTVATETTVPTTTTTTNTVPATTTTVPATTVPATTTTTTVPTTTIPATTTTVPTTTVPETTTTIPATFTTVPTTTVPATTTTIPATTPETEPPAPSAETPSGREVLPTGAVDAGDVRTVTFPVAGPVTYFNDFGACRDGCSRSHQGNDLIGDRLQPLLAMHDGVIDHLVDHPTAGYGVVIRDAEGWEYRIFHVNNDTPGSDDGADDGTWRYLRGIDAGATVQAGQVIAWMGDSGNSEASVPHAHVEIRRPDGVAINPYWSLRAAQRDANCAIATVNADPVRPVDDAWLEHGWQTALLPGEWLPLPLSGGQPGSDTTAARMWIGPLGYTPVDAAALRVGDRRYDEAVECTQPRPDAGTSRIPAELGPLLATIRAMESGGDYTAESPASSASGAYQFIDSSWAGYGGFARAKHAPPAVQDAKAAAWATAILARHGGDVSTVPVSWYLGHVPVGTEWDTVPPHGGNVLTPREYQRRWMQLYAQLLGTPEAWAQQAPVATAADLTPPCRTVVIDLGSPADPQYALTQARNLAADTTGRAVPNPDDPCDPSRTQPAARAATENCEFRERISAVCAHTSSQPNSATRSDGTWVHGGARSVVRSVDRDRWTGHPVQFDARPQGVR